MNQMCGRLFTFLQLLLPYFAYELQPAGGEPFGLPGRLCGLSVSRQHSRGGRGAAVLSELADSQTPQGPDRLSNLSSWKSQPDGGRDGACQWKLNHLSSSSLSSSSPHVVVRLPLPTGVQQGKLYRPKGRLTEAVKQERLTPCFRCERGCHSVCSKRSTLLELLNIFFVVNAGYF